MGQAQQLVAAFGGVMQRLQRRRGTAEDDRYPFPAGAHHGQIAGVVAKTVLLLEGVVMFLIDDDQARVLQRGEDGRARADDDAGTAGAGVQPGVEPLAVAEIGVQNMDRYPKASPEAGQRLGGKADLGYQHQRLAAGPEGALDRLQIDLGFAGTGDAI